MIEVSNIRNNIVLLRRERKVSQRQLADFLRVSPQTVSGWENGNYYPDIPQIINLANYFHIRIDGLFEDKKVELAEAYDVTFASFGKTVQKWRKSNEITQKELAEKLFVGHQAVSRWECGQGFPDLSIFPKLCEIMGVSLHDLFIGNVCAEPPDNAEKAQERKTEKKHIAIIASVVAVLLVAVGVFLGVYFGVKAPEPEDAPTQPENVIVINTYDEFMSYSGSFLDGSAYFVFNADIIADGHATIDGFNAVIDGRGYSVSGLTVPFIRNMHGGARISNVHFDIDITATVGMNDRVGGVVVTNYGYLENVWVSGNIDLPGQRYIGGVVGSNYGNLRNIENTASISCADYAGGIVGYMTSGTVAFSVNNGDVASVYGSPTAADDPMPVKHSGSIAGYVVSGTQLNGCITTVADIDAVNPLYGQTSSSVDFSLSALVTPDMLDQALSEWLNYDPTNGDLFNDDNVAVNRYEAVWYSNVGKWVRVDDRPRLVVFHK
ncbi:MAG: helix-turn-helix domain-containing protein [Roseburia sp.]|nr:helix-turn-helix domain-containing protein [Roseburia sp.]